jgi:hypothetical protein
MLKTLSSEIQKNKSHATFIIRENFKSLVKTRKKISEVFKEIMHKLYENYEEFQISGFYQMTIKFS